MGRERKEREREKARTTAKHHYFRWDDTASFSLERKTIFRFCSRESARARAQRLHRQTMSLRSIRGRAYLFSVEETLRRRAPPSFPLLFIFSTHSLGDRRDPELPRCSSSSSSSSYRKRVREARFCQPISCGGAGWGEKGRGGEGKHSQGVPMSWQWLVDVFGMVRTARFLYNVTASSHLGFLRRHRPSTYYVDGFTDTYFYANVALSLSLSLRYLLSCSPRSVSLSLFPFHCLPRYGVWSLHLFSVTDV